MRKRTFKAVLGLVLVLALGLTAVPELPAQEKKVYEFTVAWNDIWGPKFRASQIYRPGGEMQRMLWERSGGRIKLNIVSRMFPGTEILQAVATGKADMGDVPMPYLSGTYPLLNWGEIPGIVSEDPVKGLAEELAVYQDPAVQKLNDASLRKLGLVYWFITQWDPANGIWSKKEVNTLDDFKGLKVRVGGYLPTAGIKAMGASPVTIAGSELAPAMMAGTIDAVLTSLGYGYSIGLAKVSKAFTLTPLSPTWTAVTVMNAKKFDALPPDLQKVVRDVGRELEQAVSLSTTAEYIMSVDTVDLSGIKRTQLSEADQKKALEACKVVEQEWLKLAGDQGPEMLKAVKGAVEKYRSFTGK